MLLLILIPKILTTPYYIGQSPIIIFQKKNIKEAAMGHDGAKRWISDASNRQNYLNLFNILFCIESACDYTNKKPKRNERQ